MEAQRRADELARQAQTAEAALLRANSDARAQHAALQLERLEKAKLQQQLQQGGNGAGAVVSSNQQAGAASAVQDVASALAVNQKANEPISQGVMYTRLLLLWLVGVTAWEVLPHLSIGYFMGMLLGVIALAYVNRDRPGLFQRLWRMVERTYSTATTAYDVYTAGPSAGKRDTKGTGVADADVSGVQSLVRLLTANMNVDDEADDVKVAGGRPVQPAMRSVESRAPDSKPARTGPITSTFAASIVANAAKASAGLGSSSNGSNSSAVSNRGSLNSSSGGGIGARGATGGNATSSSNSTGGNRGPAKGSSAKDELPADLTDDDLYRYVTTEKPRRNRS